MYEYKYVFENINNGDTIPVIAHDGEEAQGKLFRRLYNRGEAQNENDYECIECEPFDPNDED